MRWGRPLMWAEAVGLSPEQFLTRTASYTGVRDLHRDLAHPFVRVLYCFVFGRRKRKKSKNRNTPSSGPCQVKGFFPFISEWWGQRGMDLGEADTLRHLLQGCSGFGMTSCTHRGSESPECQSPGPAYSSNQPRVFMLGKKASPPPLPL